MVEIRRFTIDDVPHGLRLTRQAGWNQTEADWHRLLALQPDGGLIAQVEGRPVGTLACALYGDIAWMAMMLVDQDWRGRGIGRTLMTHALRVLEEQGVPTARLDATPLGQPLYESLGFLPEYEIARHEGRPALEGTGSAKQPLDPAILGELRDLDRRVTGYDRGRLLDRLAAEVPEAVRVVRAGEAVRGYVMSRPGFRASQIGPCLADDDTGAALMDEALARHAGCSVFVDVPTDHTAALALAQSRGLTIQRRLLRMRRGAPIAEDHAAIWAIAGPELG